MSRILLLEDDEALGRGICMALETPNCTVTHCSTRLQAIKILQGVVFDLLILDINLPDGSGLELLRTLRQNGTSTPAILLTANDLELDEVTGLEAGADDYITKPFSLAVLRARVNAQLRRSVPVKQERIELNGFILDFTRMEFSKEGTIIDLSKTEQRLLRLLVENRAGALANIAGVLGNNDVSIACFDHLGSHVHTVQARAADNVDGDSGGLDGQAGFQRSLACNVLAQTSLDNTAHVNVVNLLRLDIGAVQGFLDDNGAQLYSRNIGQGAAELANGGTACRCDNDLFHVNSLLIVYVVI